MPFPSTAGRRGDAATLPAALHALTHPAALLGLGLLILNDHLLKTLTPSPLTGKLSDFAGLFVLPFFFITLLALPGDMLEVSSRRVAAFSFAFSGLWFAALKTLPPINALSSKALEWLLGRPLLLVCDPTDLAALLSLYPAWRLWLRAERDACPSARKSGGLSFVLLSWALIATSPSPPPQSVQRIFARGHTVYAVVTASSDAPLLAQSDDFGRNWRVLESIPPELSGEAQAPVQPPKTVCLEGASMLCYRIRGEARIDRSENGGRTWQTSWRAPTWRMDFFQIARHTLLLSPPPPDFIPADIALLRAPSGGAVLVAALGNQGVLVHTAEEGWRQYTIQNARPQTAFLRREAADSAPLLLAFETFLWLGMFFYLGWRTSFRLAIRRRRLAGVSPFIVVHALAALWHLALAVLPAGFMNLPALAVLAFFVALNASPLLTLALVGAGGFLYFRRLYAVLKAQGAPPAAIRPAVRSGHSVAMLSVLGGVLPLYAWVFGWIPLYWLALGLGLLLSAGLYTRGFRRAASGEGTR